MGFFDEATKNLENIGNKATDALKSGSAGKSGTAPNSLAPKYEEFISNPSEKIGPNMWYTEGADWYKIYGYRFSVAYVVNEGGNIDSSLSQYQEGSAGASSGAGSAFDNLFSGKPDIGKSSNNLNPVEFLHFTLPIPPQQMIVKPIIPSKATATLGGVVEETSQTKFWMVNMSGTTGTSISRLKDDMTARSNMANKFRDALETTGLLAGSFNGISRLANKVGNIIDGVSSAIQSGDIASGVTGVLNDTLTPEIPYARSAVDNKSNGFVEAQELQKFFFMYSALKARFPKKYALIFTNFKTDQSWRVIVKDFQLMQSADSPYLFKYNISLQCWDVRSSRGLFAGSDDVLPYDRFGSNGDLKSVNTLSGNQMLDIFAGNKSSLLRNIF